MQKILFFISLFIYSCAVLQKNKSYLIDTPQALSITHFFQNLVFWDSNKVCIQAGEIIPGHKPPESMGKWQKKGNKITVKSDLQPDSASNSAYRKVEKKLNATRSLDTVYIYALDTLDRRLWLTGVDFEGMSEDFNINLAEYSYSLLDTQGMEFKLKPNVDLALKIPKQVFLSIPYIEIRQDAMSLFTLPENDCVTGFAYVIEPKDIQFNEFFFYLKNSEEFWGYAYADWTYYLWPDGRLCSRTYGYYRKIKFRRFIRKAFPFTQKWFPKQFKYVDFFGHCLECQNKK